MPNRAAVLSFISFIQGIVVACGPVLGPESPPPSPAPPGAPVITTSVRDAPIEVPVEPSIEKLDRRRVASKLANPRGMAMTKDGILVLALAGTGEVDRPNTGAVLALTDKNQDGDYDDEAERRALLEAQPSKNILDIVRRDEVFGMADVARGQDRILATLAFFGGPSTVFEVDGRGARPLGTIHGNLNDIAFDPKRGRWFAVSSSSDEIVRFEPGGRGDRVAKLPPLGGGQDPVPGYLAVDPVSGDLIVSLFSGSVLGEAGGQGIELQKRAGKLVRFDPDSTAVSDFVVGLTAPTDLLVTDAFVYVLEFCDEFLEPIGDRAEMNEKALHGGFRRFSGRLLRIARDTGDVSVLADGLDGPTNLVRVGDRILIAQGMGTPGRPIPGPEGAIPLEGFIEAVTIETSP